MKKLFCLLIAIISVFAMFTVPASAAKGYEGYAIYNSGEWYNPFWHAGLMDEPSTSYYLPVVHANLANGVAYDSWAGFMGGTTFKGVYRPKDGITSSQRDLVKATGRALRGQNIPWNAAVQVDWYTSALGRWVYPSDIASMRCEGVVEYAHEWHYIRIYGSYNDFGSQRPYWDVTWGNVLNWDHHSGTAITPKSQAENYMTRILVNPPTGTY
jgi:hypothetical protein